MGMVLVLRKLSQEDIERFHMHPEIVMSYLFGEEAEKEPLSRIIEELNRMFGTDFSKEDEVVICQLETQLSSDEVLAQQMRSGSRDAARLSFEQVAHDMLFELIDSNFRFYRKVQDNENVARALFDRLFERYFREISRAESNTHGTVVD